jgi:hypothetical protein
MKVTNWRKKLATTLVATGLLSPAAAQAANLDTNLVANPGFETVDTAVTGDFRAVKVLGWAGITGFAYSHNGSVGSAGVVPDYADGADPPGAGNWYFTGNNNPGSATGDIRVPDLFYQDILVSAGATGTQIATGEAVCNVSAWMSSYLNDNDFGNVRVEYRNGSGGSLGFALVSDADPGPNNVWSLNRTLGIVPVGTASLRVSLFGTAVNGGSDAYIDNVDVQLSAAQDVLMYLEVNTTTGQVKIKNQTGDPIRLDYYQITSAGNALKANTWTSLQDQNLAGFPAGNGSGNGWEEAGGSSTGVLSESFLTGNSSAANGSTINLGAAFNTAGAQDLLFAYAVVPDTPLSSDFDSDGDADGSDFLTWQRGLGTTGAGATKAAGNADGDADVDGADLAVWKSEFGQGATSGAGVLQFGFVRYVTGAATAVPEPSTVLLVGLGVAAIAAVRRVNPTT